MVGCYGMLRWVHLRKVTWAAGWKATVWVGKFDSSFYILIRLDFVGSDAFVPVENMGGIECFRFGSMDLGCLGDPPSIGDVLQGVEHLDPRPRKREYSWK